MSKSPQAPTVTPITLEEADKVDNLGRFIAESKRKLYEAKAELELWEKMLDVIDQYLSLDNDVYEDKASGISIPRSKLHSLGKFAKEQIATVKMMLLSAGIGHKFAMKEYDELLKRFKEKQDG